MRVARDMQMMDLVTRTSFLDIDADGRHEARAGR
jgi:hypothetical protein